MAWVACNKSGNEWISEYKPERLTSIWFNGGKYIELPSGSIKKLIGSDLTWEDEPVELT